MLREAAVVRDFESGAFLYRQGDAAKGVYLIERGSVDLWLSDGGGGSKRLRTVSEGALLGLSESVSGQPHKLSAQAVQPTQVGYVSRKVLVEWLRRHCDVCMQVVEILSDDLHMLYDRARSVEAGSARGKRRSAPKPE
jgi:CRP-like cAMP-binding protein